MLSIVWRIRFLPLLFFCLPICAQTVLEGQVLDAEKHKPIPYATIFLSNTSVGTKANDEGRFSIHVPAGKFDLVISSIGYETFSQTIRSGEQLPFMTVNLRMKDVTMDAVVVESFEKNGWAQWGRFFIDNFIGTSGQAKNCELINPQVLRFRNSKKDGVLTVIALEPLVIENRALGYRIEYQLENFSFEYKNRFLVFAGYPFFEPMQGSTREMEKWKKARETVYYGSLMHFMRSIYRNHIIEEGFDVRAMQKPRNAEKDRVRNIMRNLYTMEGGRLIMARNVSRDSLSYYRKVQEQEDELRIINSSLLTGDSIAYAVDSVTAGLNFNDFLLVIYKPKIAPAEYRQAFPKNSPQMMSDIELPSGKGIEIQANGYYYNPLDIVSSGYWAWSEKMGTMLPFDYNPPPKK